MLYGRVCHLPLLEPLLLLVLRWFLLAPLVLVLLGLLASVVGSTLLLLGVLLWLMVPDAAGKLLPLLLVRWLLLVPGAASTSAARLPCDLACPAGVADAGAVVGLGVAVAPDDDSRRSCPATLSTAAHAAAANALSKVLLAHA